MKKTAILFLILFSASVLFFQCMKFAADKPFNGDEIGEFIDILSQTTSSLLLHGARNTPSKPPFYYILQKETVRPVLKKEMNEKQGWNWRLSLRLLPAMSLVIATIIAALIMIPVSPIMAVFIPISMSLSNFALYYGGEARSYATWLGLCLIFFVVSLRLVLSPDNKKWNYAWLFMTIILCMTMVSSSVLVCLTASGIFYIFRKKIRKHKRLLTTLLGGILLSYILYYIYRHDGTVWFKGINERPLSQHIQTFIDYTLVPLDKTKNTIKLLLLLAGFVALGLGFKKSRSAPLYYAFGILGFLFFIGMVVITALQLYFSYPILGRHVIFGVVIKVLAFGLLIHLILDILEIYVFPKYKKITLGQRRLLSVLLVSCFAFDWFQWNVRPLPQLIGHLRELRTTYCHTQAWVENPTRETNPNILIEIQFNALNRARHSGQCDAKGTEPGEFWGPSFDHIFGVTL